MRTACNNSPNDVIKFGPHGYFYNNYFEMPRYSNAWATIDSIFNSIDIHVYWTGHSFKEGLR